VFLVLVVVIGLAAFEVFLILAGYEDLANILSYENSFELIQN
jgi:hypothetical protein